MRWYHWIAYFFAGAFLMNTVPHLVAGVSGNAFQSSFASPPGVGLSSSTVNVLWGMFNLVAGYTLACRVGRFDVRRTSHVAILFLGMLLMALQLAQHFGQLHGGLPARATSIGSRRTSALARRSARNSSTPPTRNALADHGRMSAEAQATRIKGVEPCGTCFCQARS